MSVKEYYYQNIWPKIEHGTCDINIAEKVMLEIYENADWVKKSFKKLKDENVPLGKIGNLILEQVATETITWFKRKNFMGNNMLCIDVERKFAKGNIFVGEYPSDELNACICFIPEANGYLVLFNSNMMRFLLHIIKIMTSFTDFVNGELKIKEKRVFTKEEAVNYIKETALAYKKTNKFPFVRDVINPDTDKDLWDLQEVLNLSIQKFILAHEFAHCALGHLNNKTTKTMIVPNSSLTLNIILKTHKQEFDADACAAIVPLLHINSNIPKNYDLTKDDLYKYISNLLHIVWGSLFFFSFIEIIDKVFNNVNSITHPSSSFRYMNIRNRYEQILRNEFFFKVFDLYRSFLEEVKNSL